MAVDVSRRQFFRSGPFGILKGVVDAAPDEGAAPGEEADDPRYIRPPGASPDDRVFLSFCEKCKACSTACPHEAIFHLGPEGGTGEGTPFMAPDESPCQWCSDFPCIDACPSGALAIPEDKKVKPIAEVELNLDLCLNNQGTLCDDCSLFCPATVRAIKMKGRVPALDKDLCVGCGLCVYRCPAEPRAIDLFNLKHFEDN